MLNNIYTSFGGAISPTLIHDPDHLVVVGGSTTPIHFHRSTHVGVGGGRSSVQDTNPSGVGGRVCRGGGGLAQGLGRKLFSLAAPTGLSPLNIPTLCGSELCLVVSTEPLDDLSCLTTLGPAVPDTHAESMLSLPAPVRTCVRRCLHLQDFPNRGL